MFRFLLMVFLLSCSLAHGAEFLEPAMAFKPSVRAKGPQELEVRFDIAEGYYLYRNKFKFAVEGDGLVIGSPLLPKGKEKQDENFGKVEVYQQSLSIQLPVKSDASASRDIKLTLTYQGCAEAGLCYPPQTRDFSVTLPRQDSVPTDKASALDESGQIANTLKTGGFLVNLAFFFLAGIGLSLTPCVFPMIPILSGIIAGQGSGISRSRAFLLSLAYVMGMAMTYTCVGIVAGLSGTLVSAALQNPWVLGSFAAIFVALAFSMFGFYELQLPTSLQSKLSDEAGHLQGGRGLGVFVMGALSALIVGPCVAAPLAGALLYIGQTGDAVLGGAALFAMALGMGMPLLIVGLSAGTLLPRAGAWMEGVKKFFGVLLLGTAVWLVTPVIPAAVQMLAWSVLLIIPAIYLHGLDPLPANARGWQRFWKGIGIVMLLTGASLLIGTLAGSRDPLQPLAGLRGGGQAWAGEPAKLPFETIHTVEELEKRLKTATGPIMLDFYADWCVSCKEMERFTFGDGAVKAKLGEFALLKADVTRNSAADKALLARFGLFGPPGIIFFDREGKEARGARVLGFLEAPRFLENLQRLKPL